MATDAAPKPAPKIVRHHLRVGYVLDNPHGLWVRLLTATSKVITIEFFHPNVACRCYVKTDHARKYHCLSIRLDNG